MQSAATFLGAPDNGFRADFTYLGTNLGTLMGAIFVGFVLIPKFYANYAATVYELLKIRYSQTAMRWAGGMFLFGRVLAEGSRIYLAAIAVSMMIFSSISFEAIAISSCLIILISLVICIFGGLKSVIWTDLILFIIYIGAALGSFFYLLYLIPIYGFEIIKNLKNTPEGIDKTKLFDFGLDFSKPFSFFALITGMFLLSTASVYFDFDTSALSADQQKVIHKLINDVNTYHPTQITVTGHTDTSGSAEYNQQLSAKRADTVSKALSRYNVSSFYLNEAALGVQDLAVPTPDNTKLSSNRRVVVQFRK